MMNHPMKPSTNSNSNSDSFFGMALAQAFMGMAFGAGAEQIWDAGEAVSAIYEDRFVDQKRTNGRGVYELGNKNSLVGTFARMTEKSISEIEREFFRPLPRGNSLTPSFA